MKKMVCFLLLFLCVTAQRAWAFSDVDGLWCETIVNEGEKEGLWVGDGTLFLPEQPATRAEAVALLFRLSGEDGSDGTFLDVPPTVWYAPAMGWAQQKGIVAGEGGKAYGDRPLVREELWAMAARWAKAEESEVWQAAADGELLSPWAKTGASWCLKHHLISENDYDCIYPRNTISRGEMAVFFWQYRQVLGQEGTEQE